MNTEEIILFCIASDFTFGGYHPDISSGKDIIELNELLFIMDLIHERIYGEDESFPSEYLELDEYPHCSEILSDAKQIRQSIYQRLGIEL